MQLSQQQIIDIKCIICNVKKAELAIVLGINKSILSREIKDKSLLKQIDNYFESKNPNIDKIISRLTNENDLPIVEEPQSHYSRDEKYIDRLLGMIDEKSLIIQAQQTLIRSYERTLNKEHEISKKQTGS